MKTWTSNPPAWLALAIALALLIAAAIAWWTASLTTQIALVTALLILVLWGIIRIQTSISRTRSFSGKVETLLEIAKDTDVAAAHDAISASLLKIASNPDPIYRPLALQSLRRITNKCSRLSDGIIEYSSTETWRVVYEELLRSPGLHLYRSVAYIETAHYWQDGPGRQSTLLNLELHDAGIINIERIAIVADHLWPANELPSEPIATWLNEQHSHAIWLKIVRESQLAGETDLLSDFGIYGSRAVGMQLSDVAGRTTKFLLSFDFERVLQAERNWKRLQVFSVPYRDVLDHKL